MQAHAMMSGDQDQVRTAVWLCENGKREEYREIEHDDHEETPAVCIKSTLVGVQGGEDTGKKKNTSLV
jgi:hypothetical protein